jgi:hypothetical protein
MNDMMNKEVMPGNGMSRDGMSGGRRHMGTKKRHGNASLRAWVTFVKKVQREEGVGYKEAMTLAKKRKDKGEKWRGGANGDAEKSDVGKSSADNIDPVDVEDAMMNNREDAIAEEDFVPQAPQETIDAAEMPLPDDDEEELYGGRRRRRRGTKKRRGSKKRRGTKKRRGSRRRRH